MTDAGNGVLDQENIPPFEEISDTHSKANEKAAGELESEQRQRLSQLQNTDIVKKISEDSEESLSARDSGFHDSERPIPSLDDNDHFSLVHQILDELILALPPDDGSSIIERTVTEDSEPSNREADISEHGCDLQANKFPSKSEAIEQICDLKEETSANPTLEGLVAELEITPVSCPLKEEEPAGPCETGYDPVVPFSMPSGQKEEPRSDLSLEASPAHSCKTDATSDSFSNEKESLLDENVNPSKSDVENNVPVIQTEPSVICTPKRKNESEVDSGGECDGFVTNGKSENNLDNSAKASLMDFTTPISAKKVGVASANRRPGNKLVVEDQTSNQSEAGPQVAEFTEEEFRSCAEVFKDPDSFEFLQKAGSSSAFQESALSRLSLYVKFDPLVNAKTPVNVREHKNNNNQTPEQRSRCENRMQFESETIREESFTEEKAVDVAKLIDYTPDRKDTPRTTRVVSVEPVQKEQKVFTEADMKKAMQIQDLLYRERILAKEKELVEKEKRMGKVEKENSELKTSVKAARCLMEEVVGMLKQWQNSKERDRVDVAGTNQKLIKDRDQALEDLQSVEAAFADLHRRYEKTKGILENMKKNETSLRDQLAESVSRCKKQEQMYEVLRNRTEEKLESANVEIETAKRSGQSEIAVLGSQLKKAEMKIGSLERSLEQKNQEYAELSGIYDDLIARVGQRAN